MNDNLVSRAEKTFLHLTPEVRIAAVVATLAALVAAIALALWLLSAPQRAATAAAQTKAANATATAMGRAVQDATRAVDQAAAADHHTLDIRVQNAARIQAMAGAAEPALQGQDAAGWVQGLCRYESTKSDPACAGASK